MDVTCERCRTEYELDDTLLGERGTNVKCTNCGFVFRVEAPRPTRPTAGVHWTVRTQDGRVLALEGLRDLQALIARGEVGPDDEVSRTGQTWKALRDIAELDIFFAAADAAREGAARRGGADSPFKRSPSSPPGPPTAPVRPSSPGGPIQRVGHRVSSVPAEPPTGTGAPRERKMTMQAWGAAPSSPPREPTQPFAPPTDTAADTFLDAPTRVAEPPPSDEAPTVAEWPAPSPLIGVGADPPPPEPAPKLFLADEDRSEWQRPEGRDAPSPRRTPWGVVVAASLVGLAGAAYFWGRPYLESWQQPATAAPDEALLLEADRALALDTAEGYEEALAKYGEALAASAGAIRARIGLSQTHGAIAQAARFRASDLAARLAADGSVAADLAAATQRAALHAAKAFEHASLAKEADAKNPDALIALADALRLRGDVKGGRSELARARRLLGDVSASFHLANALSAADDDSDVGSARANAERAVEADPTLLRARVVLARAHLARGDVAAARAELIAILDRVATHDGARELSAAMDAGLPPAPPVVAIPDAGAATADGGVAPPSDDSAPSAADAPAQAPRGAGTRGAPSAKRDYGALVATGDRALELGDVASARAAYRAAFDVRPTGAEALTGLGYIALEEGDAREALRRFEKAASQGYADAFIGVGDSYRRLGRPQDALAAYQGYVDRLPNGPSAGIARRQIYALRDAGGAPGAPPTPTGSPGASAAPQQPPTEAPAPTEGNPYAEDPPATPPAEPPPPPTNDPSPPSDPPPAPPGDTP